MKSLMTINDMQAIREILKKFQEGYTKRDKEKLDTYMELFIPSDEMITVGTNRSEWCFGLKETRGIFQSDWEYWGDLIIDVEGAQINTHHDTGWFVANCKMNWPPEEEGELDEWRDALVADYTGEDGRYVHYTTEQKLGMFNDIITLTIESENKKTDKLISPVRLAGGLIKKDKKWYIHRLHFWIPAPIAPEWHITNTPDSSKYYMESKENLLKHQQYCIEDSRSDVEALLLDLQDRYLRRDNSPNVILDELFVGYDDVYVVDPDEVPAAIGRDAIDDMIGYQRHKWDTMDLSTHEAVIDVQGDTAYIVTNGIFHKHLTKDALIEEQWKTVMDILREKGNALEQLYDAQKHMSSTFKELSFGEDRQWEFRLDGIAVRVDGKWKFHRLIITCPTLYTIETNYKMTPML